METAFTVIEQSGVAAAERMGAGARPAEARTAATVKAADSSELRSISDPSILEWFGGGQKVAGVTVNADTAMRTAAVWRCVTLIAGALMSLPLVIYKRTADGGRERADNHPLARLLRDDPNEDMSGPELIELITMSVLLRGNAYVLIRQARNGTVTALEYFPPTNVQPFRSGSSIWYRFTKLDGSQEVHEGSYVLHFRGPGRAGDGICGLSPVTYHAKTIGIGMATRDYTASQFESGLLTNDYFTFKEGVSEEQTAAFREWLKAKRQGLANAHNPLVMTGGGEWKRLEITARDMQLLELLGWSVSDIARVFGVPPHMIGEVAKSTSWGTGIEQQRIGFDTYTLLPHKVRFQKELNRKLFAAIGGRRPEFFCELEADGLMQGDSKAQGEFFRIALGGNQLPGFMTVNEVRRLKNLPPRDGGDELYVPNGDPSDPQPDPNRDSEKPEEEPDEEPAAAEPAAE